MAFTKYVNKKMVLKRFNVGGSMFKVEKKREIVNRGW
jgi:hypothetical protein